MFSGHGLIRPIVLLLLVAFLSPCCKGPASAQSAANAQSTAVTKGKDPECRIVGRIIKVLAHRDTIDPESPCGKEPCNALVRVEKVVVAGETPQAPVEEGKTIPVHFAFTLADTDKELFPFADIDLPGLQSNDQFEANILHRPLKHQPDRFMVFNYIKHSE